ncbi:MAG: Holliday junction branch migration protein RuvA [Planctomycetota bacterium]|nr:Holliday junction branch migration protein RuvA [Planctomycetota bacterium]
MYNHLKGKLFSKSPEEAVVETGGVGYSIRVPGSTYDALPSDGSECFLYLHLSRRDDGDTLYGFATPQERQLFLHLTSVNRVGPALALSILTAAPVSRIASAICDRDIKLLSSLKGLGKTTAERIVVDLAEKVKHLAFEETHPIAPATADAVGALQALGIDRARASKEVGDILSELPPDSPPPDTQYSDRKRTQEGCREASDGRRTFCLFIPG